MTLFWICIAGYTGYQIGWIIAHKTIASECKRLGGFFVDKETFKCVAVERED